MQAKLKQGYAPFGSVSTKKEKKKKNNSQLPGPGSYDINLPIIAPIVQTIRKKNNNIIVKLGHLGTSSFLGNNHRFTDQKQGVGPGQYSPKNQDEQRQNRSPVKERIYAAMKLKQIIKNPIDRHPTISQIKRIDFDDEVEMPSKQQLHKSRLKQIQQIRGSVWSRMTQQRISPNKQMSDNLGPGSYQTPQLHRQQSLKKQPSSSFVSNSVRSFFDQIRFETNHEDKARKREQRNYKSDIVGPGSYQLSPIRKRSFNPYQFFGSTEERK